MRLQHSRTRDWWSYLNCGLILLRILCPFSNIKAAYRGQNTTRNFNYDICDFVIDSHCSNCNLYEFNIPNNWNSVIQLCFLHSTMKYLIRTSVTSNATSNQFKWWRLLLVVATQHHYHNSLFLTPGPQEEPAPFVPASYHQIHVHDQH
jgi:hypothetical protein